MRLQIGKFLVKNIDELDSIPANQDGLKKIIDLMYMGQIEYEGNAISISRMFMEYYKEDYFFYPTQIFNKDGKQMYIFANSILVNEKLKNNPNFISNFANNNIKYNFSLWEYINKYSKDCTYDFWWNIETDYLIIFGEEKKELINYFINECLNRDGGKEEIKRKLLTVGYKI